MWGSWEEWRLPWNALYERRINELKKKIYSQMERYLVVRSQRIPHPNHTLEICWEGKTQ